MASALGFPLGAGRLLNFTVRLADVKQMFLQTMKVWIYEAGREIMKMFRRGNMKMFASEEAAQKWIAENNPEGVAFAYEVPAGV